MLEFLRTTNAKRSAAARSTAKIGQQLEVFAGHRIVSTPLGPTAPGITLPNGANLDAFDRLPSGGGRVSTDIAV